MNRELTINGIHYNEIALKEYCNDKISGSVEEWEGDYCRFILEWLNDSDQVRAKTSGSTGTPKEMYLSKQKMLNSAKLTGEFFEFAKGQNALFCLSANFIAGKMMIVRAFAWQLNLIPVSPDGHPLRSINSTIDFAAMIPLQLRNSLNGRSGLHLVKKLLIGGGAVDQKLEQDLQTLSTHCFIGYGMTETVSHVAIRPLNGIHKSDNYQAMGKAKFSIDDRNCLFIDAPDIISEPLLTNDVVHLISESKFKWQGRFDNVINSGGIKLFPEQIEKKLESIINCPFYLIGIPDEHLGQKLILLIESIDFDEKQKIELTQKMKSLLEKYEQAREIFYLEEFKRTSTGKIQREATLSLLNLSK
ncbi:AMP-binding protein [Marinifilum caeruleilacunae]|uniref:O-succinylbenzoic acid--CoA ligase n=1 Tax=Marinifilum caeruleilacunae TaxID=2499076 RepID=A0ABX1WST2_9BACT|nr:AMP-binding protein [Marinifilum caeruleilacunae]NOU58984.1 O-succinylbenzoic acid--CoA ligase [Marinifilum caeruleilacunae]